METFMTPNQTPPEAPPGYEVFKAKSGTIAEEGWMQFSMPEDQNKQWYSFPKGSHCCHCCWFARPKKVEDVRAPYGYEPCDVRIFNPDKLVLIGGKWLKVDDLRPETNVFSASYCRPIDVGEGWRLVKEAEAVESNDMIFYRDEWESLSNTDWTGRVCKEMVFKQKLLAVRRKVEKKEAGAVECHVRKVENKEACTTCNRIDCNCIKLGSTKIDFKTGEIIKDNLSARWVPVSEALPTREDGFHLIQYKHSTELGGNIWSLFNLSSVLQRINVIGDVSQWMHIPEAPPIEPEKSSEEAHDLAIEKYFGKGKRPVALLVAYNQGWYDAVEFAKKGTQ